MTSRTTHVLSLMPVALLTVVLGYHPGYWLALVAGVLLPEIDTISPATHRSWIFHTFLPSAALYQCLYQLGIGEQFPAALQVVHFATIGMFFHFLFDFVYPKDQSNDGAEWPVRPAFFSDVWGLTWLGLSWFAQWFSYLSFAFIPWLATDFIAA